MFDFDRDFDLEIGFSMVTKRSNKFTLLWKIPGEEVTGGVASSPLRYKNLVIFGCGDHYLYALDIATGEMRWRFKASQLFIDSRPSEEGGVIYIGSYDEHVYAINAENGKEIWRFRTGGKIYASCIVRDGKIYFGSQDGFVYTLDAKTGKEIWRFRTGAEVGSAPTIHNDVLYIGGYDQNLYALDPQTGEEMWRLKLGGSISNPQPHIAEDDALYVGCIDGNVYAIDIVQRKEKWRFRTAGWILASPMPAGDLIYFISSDGNIYCIDKDGALVWKFMTDAYMDGSTEALVHKGVVYCGSSNNNFYALDAMMGKELWRFRTDGEIISAPLMHENKLYFGSFDCHFYCIDIKGREVWRFKTSSSVKWKVPPASEWFEFEVKIDEEPDESIREYGKGVNVASAEFSKSEYSFKSEYASTSEYRTKSEYR